MTILFIMNLEVNEFHISVFDYCVILILGKCIVGSMLQVPLS